MSDDQLRSLFEDAVSDVAPGDRLGEIRRRTAPRPARRRRWVPVVLGAGTATAAIVGAVALIGQLDRAEKDAPATGPESRTTAVAAYFVQDERLFREFQSVRTDGDPDSVVLAALRQLEVDAGPDDPDYSTVWTDGSFVDASVEDDAIRVSISAEAQGLPESLRSPQGLPDTTASIQQVVYTAEAAIGRVLPVRFETDGRPVTQVLGGAVPAEIVRDPALPAQVNISDPAEGHEVDDLLTLRGIIGPGAGASDTVDWELRDAGTVVASGTAPVAGSAWEHTERITTVEPGTYLLVVRVPGTEGGPHVDTRTITVR